MTVMINETMLFLHRVAFANAIEHYSAEPVSPRTLRIRVTSGSLMT